MFFGINLQEILPFPLKDAESRKHFLIGCVVALAGMIIPILPFIVIFGYSARIVKQIFNDESPRMIPWDDWSGFFKDGLVIFGIRMVASLPIMILTIPIMLASFGIVFAAPGIENGDSGLFVGLIMLVMFGSFCFIVPVSLAVAFIAPAAEFHALEAGEFAAGFRFKEWWPVFRANLSGFLAAFGAYYLISMALAIVMQIAMATIILACLLPVFIPVLTLYPILIMFAANAQAYKDGKLKLKSAA